MKDTEAPGPTLETTLSGNQDGEQSTPSLYGRVKSVLSWCPEICRYDPKNPPGIWRINVLLSLATGVTIANLYYNQPILYQIADTFGVSLQRASSVATLMQGGYCAGMLLLCPLGDVFPRRPFILFLIMFTAIMWLGLCLTSSFEVFSAISFLCGFTNVTPQLVFPFITDITPPDRRATSLSFVVSTMYGGIVIGRVISGLIANYTAWRNIYWFALGIQWLLLILLFFFMPDYPSKNPGSFNYLSILASIGHYAISTPVLVQACIVTFSMMAVFTSYWSTLSFLLSSPPYNYSSLVIGLFGLISIPLICVCPVYTHYVLRKMDPLVSVLIVLAVELAGVAFGAFMGATNVAGPIVQAVVIDFANQASNIAQRGVIYTINPKASSRMNTVYMVAGVSGQFAGTAIGNKLYALGGWRSSSGLSIGFICFSILVVLVRGPKETRWLGWRGGWRIWGEDLTQSASSDDAAGGPQGETEQGQVMDSLGNKQGPIRDEEGHRAKDG